MIKQQSSTRRGSENVICDIACVVRTSSLSSRRSEKKETLLGMSNNIRLALLTGPDPRSWPGGAASVKEVGA